VDRTRTLILQEFNRLRRFAFSLTGSKADADDLVQNVVVRLLKTGIPELSNPVPWMLRVCKNLWIDELRYRNVRIKAANEEGWSNDELQSEPHQGQSQIDTGKVLNMLRKLPENQCLALSLVAVEELSYAEADEVLGVPIGTIMSRVARARANIQQQLNIGMKELLQ